MSESLANPVFAARDNPKVAAKVTPNFKGETRPWNSVLEFPVYSIIPQSASNTTLDCLPTPDEIEDFSKVVNMIRQGPGFFFPQQTVIGDSNQVATPFPLDSVVGYLHDAMDHGQDVRICAVKFTEAHASTSTYAIRVENMKRTAPADTPQEYRDFVLTSQDYDAVFAWESQITTNGAGQNGYNIARVANCFHFLNDLIQCRKDPSFVSNGDAIFGCTLNCLRLESEKPDSHFRSQEHAQWARKHYNDVVSEHLEKHGMDYRREVEERMA